jgi:hypothetical protein
MAIDTPATIAILGAGPIGLEAALYARFLGYDVRIYERGQAAQNVQRWGHVRMFTPFSMNCSSLGRAALHAQDDSLELPDDDVCPTGREWADRYLIPIAQSDLLADHLCERTEVLSVSRWEAWKGQFLHDERRDDSLFRILLRDGEGTEREESADAVIDATGVFDQVNWMGPGGAPALGERTARDCIEYRLPDVLGEHRARYAGKRTLLVGSGYSAATTATALAALAAESPGTSFFWVTRPVAEGTSGPIASIADDRLPAREQLCEQANRVATGGVCCRWLANHQIWSIAPTAGGGLEVALGNSETDERTTHQFDAIIANVGFRPGIQMTRELHVHQCYATEGPMKLAMKLLNIGSRDCLDQPPAGADALRTSEPSFYVLGAKSYGRNSQFLYANGLEQIREIFSVIGDRADLDLYATARKLPQ